MSNRPLFQKRHYEWLVLCLRRNKRTATIGGASVVVITIDDLADMLDDEEENFNRQRFMDAVG